VELGELGRNIVGRDVEAAGASGASLQQVVSEEGEVGADGLLVRLGGLGRVGRSSK